MRIPALVIFSGEKPRRRPESLYIDIRQQTILRKLRSVRQASISNTHYALSHGGGSSLNVSLIDETASNICTPSIDMDTP